MNEELWQPMRSAPRDGTPIRIAVKGRREAVCAGRHGSRPGPQWHELPYDVAWYGARWCYARHRTPLFDWHRPLFWRPEAESAAEAMAFAA